MYKESVFLYIKSHFVMLYIQGDRFGGGGGGGGGEVNPLYELKPQTT